jgi:hypothetical protein
VKAEWGLISNVVIENNLLMNQPWDAFYDALYAKSAGFRRYLGNKKPSDLKPAYTVYTNEKGNGGTPTGIVVRNNKMEKGNWGYFSISDASKVTLSGNVDSVTGKAI